MSLADNHILTTGKLFPDGVAIEQVRGNQLLLWHDGQCRIGSTIECRGDTYAPVILGSRLEQVLRLPAGTEDFGHIEDLIAELQEPVMRCGLEQEAALLVATAIVATWVADCLPAALLINPWGEVGTEAGLLDLVTLLCRRALCLAGPSPVDLASLPAGLGPTVILMNPGERVLRRLFVAAGQPNTCFVSRGEVRQLRISMVGYTCTPVVLPALKIPLLPAICPVHRVTQSEAQSLVDTFQPRLLYSRLTRHLTVANSQFDAVGFCPEVRVLARVLGAAVEGSPSLQASVAAALRTFDDRCKAEQLQGPTAILAEALLALCHTKTEVAYVGQITDLTNGLLENRGENIRLSPRAVGEMLRNLGLSARRHAPGYALLLDRSTQSRVHRIAYYYDLLRPSDCPLCIEVLLPATSNDHQLVSGA